MAIIQSGAGGTTMTVDTTSNAARTTLYDSGGNAVYPNYDGSYMVRLEIIPTTLTAATTYFSLRNTGSKRVFLRKIEMKLGFSGTAALTRSLFEIERFSTATPTGGTTLTVLKKDTTDPTSSVGDARFAPGGLTTTSVVFDSPFHLVGVTNQVTVDHSQDIDFKGDGEGGRFLLAVNEGICIRANTAIVLGAYLVGSIYWDERT